MTQEIDRPGAFQGQIIEYGLKSYDSGAIAIAVRARLDAMWNQETESWDDISEIQCEAHGYIFIVTKSGDTNKGAVESLVKFAGWDGSINSIIDTKWEPRECQFTIEENVYKDKTSYRIGFINDRDRIPSGQMSNVSADKAKELEARFGPALRAIAGSAKMNGAPAPAAKSMPAPKKKELPKEMPADASIPF